MTESNTKTLQMSQTRLMSRKEEENHIPILEDITFIANSGKEYRILSENMIGVGGESQVFHAITESDGEEIRVVAKIYDTYIDDTRTRSDRKKVTEVLEKCGDYKKTHLLPLLDYGMVEINSRDGHPFRKPVDILPYCDGYIKKATYMELKNDIIPSILTGMKFLHEKNIVHRDIKPNNILRYNGVVVLSDFGIASEVFSETQYRGTTTVRGTNGYQSPESFQGIISPSNDYYSFGCTIATLYNGEHVYKTLIDTNKFADLNNLMNEDGLPINFEGKKGEENLQSLIDSLIQVDSTKRGGYSEVKKWLENPTAFEKAFNAAKGKKENTSPQRPSQKEPSLRFSFEGTYYSTRDSLADAMSNNWNIAKKYLYNGGTTNVLYRAFVSIDQTLAVKLESIVEDGATSMNYDLGLAEALHYIENGGPLRWKGKVYNSLSDISKTYEAYYRKKDSNNQSYETYVDEIASMLNSEYLSWKIQQSSNASIDTLKVMKEIEKFSKSYPRISTYWLVYAFSTSDLKLPLKGFTTEQLFFKNIHIPLNRYFEHLEDVFYNDEILGFLCSLGYSKLVENYKSSLMKNTILNLEHLYCLYEGIVKDKTIVTKHYIEFGPYADLFYWWKVIDKYSFNNSEAEELKNKIKDILISPNSSISLLKTQFITLNEYMKEFQNFFLNNYLLTFLGFENETEQNAITATAVESALFFSEQFRGRKAIAISLVMIRNNYENAINNISISKV